MNTNAHPLSSLTSRRKPPVSTIRRHPARFCGGFLIDAEGREVAITEHMVQQACRQLDNLSVGAH